MSLDLWKEAQKFFPGGVNSPVRANVKPYPFYVKSGKGPFLFTEDGTKLLDFVLGYGPLILGHTHPRVLKSIIQQAERGWLYGTPSRAEVELARKITSHLPSAEKVRFVNSGTEATMLAVRLARGYTRKKKILKFAGNYHGAHDYVLIDAGSAVSEYNVFTSDGIPEEIKLTVDVCEYNDLECVEKKLKTEEFAGVIVEPVAGNMGVIPPEKDFLRGLRELTKSYNTVLIFDEVITGYRLGLSGAQGYFQVVPDLTTLGKIIGGGLPVGGVAGKKEIMDLITPSGKVFNAGTFNANPLTMAAGLATISELEENPKNYEVAEEAARAVEETLEEGLKRKTYTINRVKSMLQVFFGVNEVKNSAQAKQAKREVFLKFHENLLREGIFVAPSQFEAIFTSSAHTEDVMNEYLGKMKKVLEGLSW